MIGYVINEDRLAWRVVDDEAVIIHSETSEYFSLNQSATWLWSLMDAPRTARDLARALGERYACDTAADVDAYLSHLVRAGLAREESSPVPLPAGPGGGDGPRDAYEPPQLVKFGNLETLILSGE